LGHKLDKQKAPRGERATQRDTRRLMELAGMADSSGPTRFGRAIPTKMITRPGRVWLDPARRMICFSTRPPRVLDHSCIDLLDRFVALAEASDVEIEAFARRFGVLGVDPFLS